VSPATLLRRLDTLGLRLFLLMCAALVVSHVVAFMVVHGLQGPGRGFGGAPPPLRETLEAREAMEASGAGGSSGQDRGSPGPRPPPDPRAGPRDGPPPPRPDGLPPLPTLGSLPPTPGLTPGPAGGVPAPALPARALALDYGVRLVVIALAAWWCARWLARPMARLVAAAQSLGGSLTRGQRPPPLDEHLGTREVRAAAEVFNRMAWQIRQLFESRALMMASISHDLRTPLTRMRMRVETAELAPALRERCVADLAEMNLLIDAALEIFRSGAGAGREPQRIDLPALLQALVDDHVEQGHAVATELPDEALVIESDALALRRIVDNLVVNALRYAGSAQVTLARSARGVHIAVEDRGPGIAPERLAEVLQPFVRLESSRNRATGGAGLGLAIARELAEALGGSLVLGNREGGGLRAELTLPA